MVKKIINKILNKSFLTNFIALIIAFVGFYLSNQHIQSIGYYALSGAITNWLAIYMLFEKVPLLYGSGVIPNHFQEFKAGIKNLIMDQFFTKQNIENFFNENNITETITVDIEPLIASFDFDKIFEGLIDAIMDSKFGSMLSMLGGRESLAPLKEPIIKKLKSVITSVSQTEMFQKALAAHVSSISTDKIIDKVSAIVDMRLKELTPQMVKIIVQNMIRRHLGWLVVWGGVFGGLIGFVVSFSNTIQGL